MNFFRILNILNVRLRIGGLEFSESDIKFVWVKGGDLFSVSLDLAPGIIENGKVKDKNKLTITLSDLHSKITPNKNGKVYVIADISDSNVYSETFNLPAIADSKLEEAVKLNLQMISPIDFDSSYSDWQKVGEANNDSGQMEILGVFVSKKTVDDFADCLRAANFVLVAFEFPSLAISRLIDGTEGGNNFEASLLLRLDSSGLSFSVVRHGNLYFNHFVGWQGAEITMSELKEKIVSETQRVLNFYSSRWGAELNNFILAVPNPELGQRISRIISENFNLQTRKLEFSDKLFVNGGLPVSKSKLSELSPDWFAVLGSVVRGFIPRENDLIVSLASVGTEEEFRQQQLINFIKIWRNAVLVSFFCIAVAFAGVKIFLARNVDSLNEQLANISNLRAYQQLTELQNQAKEFNKNIDLALEAKNRTTKWSPFFEKMNSLTGSDITIQRIFIQSFDVPVLVNAQAKDEQAIIGFKDNLTKQPQFGEVSLPLSGITPSGNAFSFTVSFKIKSLNF